MPVLNVMVIYFIVVEIFQFEPKWWTDLPKYGKLTLPSLAVSMAKKLRFLSNFTLSFTQTRELRVTISPLEKSLMLAYLHLKVWAKCNLLEHVNQ